ncbi:MULTISPECIES: ribosome maturation factor RimM [Fictibacillus]|jgi:16S rRNA processing protein RimM|uniref:ribosome maturation factor RimM n=1 Tax=Fictibacillus TaxID=1329200 RepID=UPI0018CE2A35|nr:MULTISPECIES: ribosome maturation factor RimM [Fictibacillus]MBH0155858.1 ribosome maturation factor RimM [Fictibacillus sp. 5RED26]MBH0161008.1 ribosome maturation factor RimM [Fictibacillus sp. 26RED30]MBH0165900.1 ribosome maturation factor RimM [Fictibacillus sp. 7GRE50]MBH0173051.1 ribosome maturation factor RimM [Fictibacillus sp. 23RED33]MED1864259.1 ribosome maturation factor RimM [Fictibacillus nanhaiensis]
MENEWLNVGKIVNTHGIRGEVRVISRTDFPEERYKIGNTLYVDMGSDHIPVKIETHRKHKQFDLLTFENLHNINDVERFKGNLLKVPKEQSVSLDEGEFFYHDIIGCSVFTVEGEELGKVKEILSPGANDVWVVKRKGFGSDILIPYIPSVVKSVDVKESKIVIEPLEGLF